MKMVGGAHPTGLLAAREELVKFKNITILLTLLISGCAFVSGPKEKVNLSSTTSLENIDGMYKNGGDPSQLLSQIIFGYPPIKSDADGEVIEHKDITHISVSVEGNTVIVRAINNDCYSYEKAFIEGSDFDFRNGEIVLKHDVSLLSRGSGDVLAGPSYERITLGLEKTGHGAYRSQVYAGGLVFLLVPMAFVGLDEVRFERIKSNKIYNKCSS